MTNMELIEKVADSLSMGYGAWDTVDPEELAGAFREALGVPERDPMMDGNPPVWRTSCGCQAETILTVYNYGLNKLAAVTYCPVCGSSLRGEELTA